MKSGILPTPGITTTQIPFRPVARLPRTPAGLLQPGDLNTLLAKR